MLLNHPYSAIAEAEQKCIDIDRQINDTTITFNTLINQKQQDYNHMMDIQDIGRDPGFLAPRQFLSIQ